MKIRLLLFCVVAAAYFGCGKPQPASTPVTATVAVDSMAIKELTANLGDELPDTLVFKDKQTLFRIVEDLENYRYAVERLDNNQWTVLDSIDRPRGLDVLDWNKDGFLDILLSQRWVEQVCLFNPNTMRFEDLFDVGEPEGCFLIDTAKQLYYSMLTNKYSDEHSRLFSIENYRPILRGYIQGYVGDTLFDVRDKPLGIYVYKIKNVNLKGEELYEDSNAQLVEQFSYEQYLKENTSEYVFYKNYWTKNASKF